MITFEKVQDAENSTSCSYSNNSGSSRTTGTCSPLDLFFRNGFSHDDEYRIGVIGSSGVGKTSICAKVHRETGTSVQLHAASSESLKSTFHHNIQSGKAGADNVISVVITKSGPLGVKLGRNKSNIGFVSLQSFVRAANGSKYELEKDGRLRIGDVLVAINRCTLANLTKNGIREILENFNQSGGPRVLTFIRPSATTTTRNRASLEDRGMIECENLSIDGTMDVTFNSTTTAGIYIEKPSVNVRISTLEVDGRKCRLEIVDIPGHDHGSAEVQSWVRSLDGVIAVYSADSAASLRTLEKRYGQLVSLQQEKDMHHIPIVVVCNKSDLVVECKDDLVLEGRSLAEAWGAKFFENNCLSSSAIETITIFEEVVREVNRKMTLSLGCMPKACIPSMRSDVCMCISAVSCGQGFPGRRRSTARDSTTATQSQYVKSISHSQRSSTGGRKSPKSPKMFLPLLPLCIGYGVSVEEAEVEESVHSVVTDINLLKVAGEERDSTSVSMSLRSLATRRIALPSSSSIPVPAME